MKKSVLAACGFAGSIAPSLPTWAAVVFSDNFETAGATPYTWAEQEANASLRTDNDPVNTAGAAFSAQAGQWFHFNKTGTPIHSIQITSNTTPGAAQGSKYLRIHRDANQDQANIAAAVTHWNAPLSSGILTATFKAYWPNSSGAYGGGIYFVQHLDNDHSGGTTGSKPTLFIREPDIRVSENSFASNYNIAAPIVDDDKWQTWTIAANLDTRRFTVAIDGVTSGQYEFNYPGSQITGLNFNAQAGREWYLDDLVINYTAGPGRFEPVGTFNNSKTAFVDYDRDGLLDFANNGQLYRNNGGTFSAGPTTGASGSTVWGDYDRDGYLDAFDYTNQQIHRNNRNGTFSPIATPNIGPMVSRGAVWGDFNRDGALDLYVGGYEADDLSAYHRDRLLTNNRDGTFSVAWTQPNDALTTPGRPRPARGVTACDWDRDGDLDVYISNYRLEPNALMRNNGSGTFTDVAATHNALATSPGYHGGHSIGAVWGDFDNDGLFDLFAGNFAHAGQPQSRFLKNRGPTADYAFQDMGTGGVFYQESYATPTAGDIDNDGDLDLYFTTVYAGDSPVLFRNDGNFVFTDVTTAWGLPGSGTVETYQAAFADYDRDGYLDLFTNGVLYRNAGGTNHWLEINVDGTGPLDATAIGTQLLIQLNGQTLVRQVEGAVGEGNQNDSVLHFGLGSSTGPLTLEVRWSDGTVQSVNVANVDRLITLSRTGLVSSNWTAGSGNWNDPSNWSAGVPNAIGAVARFPLSSSGSQAVSANTAITVGGVVFSGSTRYTIDGKGHVSIGAASGAGSIMVAQGSQQISVPVVFTSDANINVANGATLTLGATTIKAGKTVNRNGNLLIQGPLTVEAGGSLIMAGPGASSLKGAPTLGAGASLNLQSYELTIDYMGQATPASTIRTQLAGGYNGGAWNGSGIKTSSAIAGETGLGWRDNPASELINIRYAFYGDTNLSGNVDSIDFNEFAAGYGRSVGATWASGDFNYDEKNNSLDFNLLAGNFGQTPLPGTLPGAGIGAVVPEPTSAVLVGLAGLLYLRRRHA